MLAIEIGTTVILGVVIYYMATQALAGREQWAIFLAYIAALRMTLTGVAQSIRAFASVSRFYPQTVRYYLFIKDTANLDTGSFAKIGLGDTVIPRHPSQWAQRYRRGWGASGPSHDRI